MRSSIILAALAVLAGCGPSSISSLPIAPKPPAQEDTPIEGLQSYKLGAPVSYDNLTVVPVKLTRGDDTGKENYLSLTEAKEKGLVEISEMPSGQEVNRLFVNNLASQPLLLLGGELLLGGKQDRVVAKDVVIPAHQELAVAVCCVEHGRWTGPSDKFSYSGTMAPQAVREKAAFGGQQQVWDEVERYNQAAGEAAKSTSVRGGLTADRIQSDVRSGLDTLTAGLDRQRNVVGLVYVSNGEIKSFELFGRPGLLTASRAALLKGFLEDAAVRAKTPSPPVDRNAISRFIHDSLLGARSQTALGRGEASWSVEGRDTRGVESTLPKTKAVEAGAAPAPADLLHGTYTRSIPVREAPPTPMRYGND